MDARTTQLEIDTLRVPIDDAVAHFETEVLPRLRMTVAPVPADASA